MKKSLEFIGGRMNTGLIFSVCFHKQNGEVRVLKGRMKTRIGVKGTGGLRHKTTGVIRVFDLVRHEWRAINPDRIIYLNADGEHYTPEAGNLL